MATPQSSNSPPSPQAVVVALRGVKLPELRDGPPPTHTPHRPERELPPEWQWQRYLDLSG